MIALRKGQTTCGENGAERKTLSLYSFVVSLKNISLNFDFIFFFQDFQMLKPK